MKNTSVIEKKIKILFEELIVSTPNSVACGLRRHFGIGLIVLLSFGMASSLKANRSDSLKVVKAKSIYKEAGAAIKARDWKQAEEKSGIAAQLFIEAGEFAKACIALEQQANACNFNHKKAIVILDKAIQIHSEHLKDTSLIFYRIQTNRVMKLFSLGRYEECFTLMDQAKGLEGPILKLEQESGHSAVFFFMLKTVEMKRDLGIVSGALEDAENALAFGKAHANCVQANYIALGHSTLSQVFRRTNNFYQAKRHNRLSLELLLDYAGRSGQDNYDALRLDADLGAILISSQEYSEAKALLRRVYLIAKQKNLADLEFEAPVLNNLGRVYMFLGDLDSAWKVTVMAKSIYEELSGESSRMAIRSDINLAGICYRKGDFEAGVKLARQAAIGLSGQDVPTMEGRAQAWLEVGRNYVGIGMRDSAKICIDRIQDVSRAANGQIGLACSFGGIYKAKGQMLLENFDSAEVCLVRALSACVAQGWKDEPLMQIDFEKLLAENTYLAILGELGKLKEKLYQLTACLEYLEEASEAYSRAAELIAHLDAPRQDYSKGALLEEHLWKDHFWILDGAVRTSMQLHRKTQEVHHLHTALVISDMCKARQISKLNLSSRQELQKLIPPDLAVQEQKLKLALDADRRIAGQSESVDDQASKEIRIRLNDNEIRFKDLLKRLKKEYPRYSQLKYGNEALWQQVQALSRRPAPLGHVQLEYFVGADSIYAFLITQNGISGAVIPGTRNIETMVRSYKAALKRLDGPAVYCSLAMELCKALIPFPRPNLLIRELCIIPDGFLSDLPFEALIRHDMGYKSENGGEPPFLIRFVPIHYDFSLIALDAAKNRHNTSTPVQRAIAIVPSVGFSHCNPQNGTVEKLEPVQGSDEWKAIAPYMQVEYCNGDQATAATLQEVLQTNSLVEIKTHGQIEGKGSESEPYLVMSDGHGKGKQSPASGLYGIRDFEAPLVVLNSCYSAEGEYQIGEGELSHVRSMRMAGCPSVVANKWLASDEANTFLLEDLFTGLAKGRSLAEALRLAKLEALESSDEVRRHPHYWAGLNIYGYAGNIPIAQKPISPWPYILAALALVALTWAAIRRRTHAA